MKKIINWSLVLVSIFSIGIALKFSALPVPAFLPDEIARFWITTPEEQQQYVLLYDISVGIVLSSLFYFVVDEIPNFVRQHKAKRLLSTYVNQLIQNMEQLISIIIAKYEKPTNLALLASKDFLCLNGETQIAQEELSYSYSVYSRKNNARITGVRSFGTIDKLVKTNLKHILEQIDNIKNYEYFYATDDSLVECIRSIESCKLIKYYHKPSDAKKESTPCFRFHGTEAAMDEFVQLYLKLIKLNYHTQYSTTILETKDETEQYRSERESGVMINNVLSIQNEKRQLAVENPTIIIYGDKYTTQILVTELLKRIIAVPYPISKAKGCDLSEFKYAILVFDSDSSNDIQQLLRDGLLPQSIVLLTEKNIIYKSNFSRVKKYGIEVKAELFFKSTFQIGKLPAVFNREEPSGNNIATISKRIEEVIYGKHY